MALKIEGGEKGHCTQVSVSECLLWTDVVRCLRNICCQVQCGGSGGGGMPAVVSHASQGLPGQVPLSAPSGCLAGASGICLRVLLIRVLLMPTPNTRRAHVYPVHSRAQASASAVLVCAQRSSLG
jgi:hypothetical protein